MEILHKHGLNIFVYHSCAHGDNRTRDKFEIMEDYACDLWKFAVDNKTKPVLIDLQADQERIVVNVRDQKQADTLLEKIANDPQYRKEENRFIRGDYNIFAKTQPRARYEVKFVPERIATIA